MSSSRVGGQADEQTPLFRVEGTAGGVFRDRLPLQGQRSPGMEAGMRLKTSRASAQEQITSFLTDGYTVLNRIRTDYSEKRSAGTFDAAKDAATYREWMNLWARGAVIGLRDIFPTEMEANAFFNA